MKNIVAGKVSVTMMSIVLLLCPALLINLTAQQWQTAPQLTTPRFGATAVTLNGKIYVMGGSGPSGILAERIETFEVGSTSWNDQSTAPLRSLRLDAASTVWNGKIYLTGGLDANGEVVDTAEVYDESTNSWSKIRKMRDERRGHSLVVINNFLVAVGGVDDDDEYVEKIEYYDVSEDEWEDAEDEILALRAVPFSGVFNEKLYLFGGILSAPVSDGFAGIFDTNWNISWSSLPSLTQARGNGSSVVCGDSLYMIGGITSNGTSSSLVEIYDSNQNITFTGSPLPSGRIGASAARIDSLIYVIGGYTNNPENPSASVLSFNTQPITGLEPQEYVPSTFIQAIGYPNPFNGQVTINVFLPRAGQFDLIIFDITGKKVRQLASKAHAVGKYAFEWDARDKNGFVVSSGIYFAVYRQQDQQGALKLIYSR
ncbi:MAG: Kelch repeat-containing protein [Calditrichia bacterium]